MEWVGIIAGVLTSASLLPQFIKLLKTKKAEDISLFFLFLLISGLAMWVWYGIIREDIPIIVTNAFSLLLNGLMIFFGIRYKKAKS
jgi:MtN3 and saliva related transmembrane protein